MFYAALKAVHLLSIIAWVGGMFFMHVCLRPAAAVLEPERRLALLHETIRRFFTVVAVAATLAVLSGAVMIAIARSAAVRSGLPFNMPLDWYAMVVLGIVMVAIFARLRLSLFPQLAAAVAAGRWADGAAALAVIRIGVLVNLVLGVAIVVVLRLGGTA